MKLKISTNVKQFVKSKILDSYCIKSYSQEGEDMILKRIFEGQLDGFYVDIGAHHPMRFSNTYYFYKKGWRGINIDPIPGMKVLFNKFRPKDINLEMGISNEPGLATYYRFNEPALNSFDESLSLKREKETNQRIIERVKIKTDTLNHILETYKPKDISKIDFMSIDVEGLDLDVLKSNDWERYRPRYLLVESLTSSLGMVNECAIYQYLANEKYDIFGKTYNTYIYVDTNK